MAKKHIEVTSDEEMVSEALPEVKQILTDFGRADLNELRDVVNELLRR